MVANIVVVESPAKAKTLEKYLGPGFKVLASYGHVRDLPAKDGSVRPENDFSMTYVADEKGGKHVAAIAKAVKGAETLFLATDPDREGEAISWHVVEELKHRKALKDVAVKRVAFHEITRSAVLAAMAEPRDLDMDLINAQQARRALDYLVGFTLSPILWRKLPGSRSAGRVQSVALRLICEREMEIEAFKPQEYWTVEANFTEPGGKTLPARLTRLDGRKLGKFDLPDEAAAKAATATIESRDFTVAAVERKQVKRNPAPPFTTSTIQQEASRKLGFGARKTMMVAQKLYEGLAIGGETVGLITYMRTDSVNLANEAVTGCRTMIVSGFGPDYLPDKPRVYRSRAKNAQEAHEAIRPTAFHRRPQDVASYLDKDQTRLYELIWKRAAASQMASAVLNQVGIDIEPADGKATLRATGSTIAFDGFLALYIEGRDDNGSDDEGRILPNVAEGAALVRRDVTPSQHFTEPPPRFSEATLVKRLEELGIGRPSTYASIISVLQERNYVRLDSRRFYPEDRGRLVTAFLECFFQRYVEYDFTAQLEDKLDEISNGRVYWKDVLTEFWGTFKASVYDISGLRVSVILDALNDLLGPHIFPATEDGGDPRLCPGCKKGQLSIKVGRFGAFVGCSSYPECRYTRALTYNEEEAAAASATAAGPRELGMDPASDLPVTVRRGPYGFYLQIGEAKKRSKEKPKRASIPKGYAPDTIDLDTAVGILSLPREVGAHPESGKTILAGLGRFGPYVKHDGVYFKLPADEDILAIGLNRAVTVIVEGKGRRRANEPLREIGAHPSGGAPIVVMKGRYGPYLKHDGLNATLPKDVDVEAITLDEAVTRLEEYGKPAKGGRRKTPARKPSGKKKTAGKKKASSGKTTSKRKTATKRSASSSAASAE